MITAADARNANSPPAALPRGWHWARLGEVCAYPVTSTDPIRDAPEAMFRYIDISSVDNRLKRIISPTSLLGKAAPSRARQRVNEGDVLVATTRPNLNAVAVIPPELDGEVASTGFCVLRANGKTLPGWLFAYVRSPDFVSTVSALVNGAMYPAVTDRQILASSIPLPPLAEQRRIAAILDEQMASIERARTAAEQQLEAARALPSAYLRAVFESDEAQAWPVRRLGDVAEVQLGKMLSPQSKTGLRPRPYLRNANVQWNRFDLTDVAEMDFDDDEQAKFELRSGDLLVCEGGEPGRAAIWSGQIEPCFYQKALHRLRPKRETVDPRMILYRLQLGAYSGEFTASHGQTTIAHLPAVRLKELRMALPSLDNQRRIAALLDEQMAGVERMVGAAREYLAAIEGLQPVLLRRAFRGEL